MSRPRRIQEPAVARSRRGRGEGGFTLLELSVVVGIMAIFGFAISTSLDATTKTTTSTQNKNYALHDVRLAVESISRDLRAANPVEAVQSPLTVEGYASRISFTVYCATVGENGCTSAHARKVVYEVKDNALSQIVGLRTRNLLQPAPHLTSLPLAQRSGAVVNPPSRPVFTYITQKGTELSPTSGTSATTFRNCTKTVKIHLVVMADPRRPDTAVNLITSVDLRNSNEVTNCP